MNEAQWQQRILNGQTFITYDNRSRQNVLTDQAHAADANTKFDVFAFEPWAASGGKKDVVTSSIISKSGIALSAKIKDPETAVKFLDYLYSPEGSSILTYGIEGVSYKMDNGKIVALPPYDDPSNSSKMLKKNMGARYPGVETIHRGDLTGVAPRDQERDAIYSKHFVPAEPFLPATKEEEEKLKNTDTKKYFQEETTKFIMGRTPITDENLTNFYNNLNKLGLADVVKIKNDEYQRAYGK
jgi:putative aldouronate transport system substrate-binding protein